MDFPTLYERISPSLKRIARSHHTGSCCIDADDLYQEMSMHLWQNFKHGVPSNINDAYIIRGCQFHILNYLRKVKEKVIMLSLEEPLNSSQDTLRHILPHQEKAVDERVDRTLAIDYIKNNGFTKREKEVFALLLQGYTTRETGKKLGISHVMVVKFKQRLMKKWQRKKNI